jgi:exosortase
MSSELPSKSAGSVPRRSTLVGIGVWGLCVIWSLWPMLREMARRWTEDPTYSHGFLVPLFAAGVLWTRRKALAQLTWEPSAGWGLALVTAGMALQVLGTLYFVNWVVGVALIVYLAGGCVLLGGWPLLRWAAPALGFLIFMVPLPYRFEVLLRGPMRRLSTAASAYVLRAIGLPALDEGTIIHINDHEIGVIEACSGLKMLITFLAFATAVVLVVRDKHGQPLPWLDKVLIVLSAVPIAMVSNVVRITVTGLLDVTVGDRIGDLVFHDLAGWFMMPVGLALLWLELKLLAHLLIEEPARDATASIRLAGVLVGPSPPAPGGLRQART